MRSLSTNGPAVHELERAEHIPVLCQKMLHQSLSFLFVLFKSHCGSPHVFINEEEKGGETGTTLGFHNQARVVFTQQVPTLCYRLCSRHSVGRVLGKHGWEHKKAASTNADGDVAKAMSLGVKISVAF